MLPFHRQATVALALSVAIATTGCDDNEDNDKVLDAIIFASDSLFDAIETDETWRTTADQGIELQGEINIDSGSLTAFGWRNTVQHDTASGTYLANTEKLFVTLNQWASNGMLLNGSLVLTRHTMDFGPVGGNIDDASRTTWYLSDVITSGGVEGSFAVDVHANAAGATVWTCGTVNGSEIEHGACY